MSSFPADIAIWILLTIGVAFGVLGFFGLLIFPDIKSRMFTASRATMIGAGLVILSVILYGINGILTGGQEIYTALVIHTVILLAILVIGTIVVTQIIHDRVAETVPPLEINK